VPAGSRAVGGLSPRPLLVFCWFVLLHGHGGSRRALLLLERSLDSLTVKGLGTVGLQQREQKPQFHDRLNQTNPSE